MQPEALCSRIVRLAVWLSVCLYIFSNRKVRQERGGQGQLEKNQAGWVLANIYFVFFSFI